MVFFFTLQKIQHFFLNFIYYNRMFFFFKKALNVFFIIYLFIYFFLTAFKSRAAYSKDTFLNFYF